MHRENGRNMEEKDMNIYIYIFVACIDVAMQQSQEGTCVA
jgi:hypothetical protein